MEKHNYIGKTKEEAINQALIELQEVEENLFINVNETKGGLFKSKKVEIEVITREEIIKFIKDFIRDLTNKIGIHTNIEVKHRENNTVVTLFSDNNALLIGKVGRTMESLEIIVKQAVCMQIGQPFPFILDIGEYKLQQQKNIEFIARKVAKEVAKTKIAAKLDPMNSYERRLVHTALAEIDGVITESEGENPNRYVMIKPKEDK